MRMITSDPRTQRRLFLFDIDGTLLTSGGAGEQSLRDAVQRAFGREEDLSGIHIPGATDTSIARMLLEKHGIPPTIENQTLLLDTYVEILRERISLHNGSLLPGILPFLEALHGRHDVVLALLTGNLRAGAEIKLVHYGVWHFFEFGAFADDHHDRNQLGPVARARALEKHGEEFPPDRIYILGDTPRDIACGKAIGAKTVAIATGGYSLDELAAHDPDYLFDSLENLDKVLAELKLSPKE